MNLEFGGKNMENELLEYQKKMHSLNEEDKMKRKLYLQKKALGKILGPTTGYASIDRPWLKFYEKGVLDTSIPDKSIYQVIKENNKNIDYRKYLTEGMAEITKLCAGKMNLYGSSNKV